MTYIDYKIVWNKHRFFYFLPGKFKKDEYVWMDYQDSDGTREYIEVIW